MAASTRIDQIQDTLDKARDELSKVDENIKKVTGRDPSEYRLVDPPGSSLSTTPRVFYSPLDGSDPADLIGEVV